MHMASGNQGPTETPTAMLALEDFGKLIDKYQSMGIAARAHAVLDDSAAVMQVALKILGDLTWHPKARQAYVAVRADSMLIGKIRPSEAKNVLLDDGADFTEAAIHKLLAWQKTMARISQGEGIVREKDKEYIPNRVAVAAALASVGSIDSYLAIIQLVITEISRLDSKNAEAHKLNIAKIRRCATLISDYDNASSIRSLVH